MMSISVDTSALLNGLHCGLFINAGCGVFLTSLTLSRVSFLPFLGSWFKNPIGSKALSDLQKRRRCSIFYLIDGVDCTNN